MAPPGSQTGDPRRYAALGIVVASGFAALGYQIVWTQQCALWLGHDTAAVLAVVAAFFGGLAVGALLLGPRVERGRRPERWYAACEATVGLWSLALAVAMAPAADALLHLTGTPASAAWQWSVAFLGTFLLLLPATVAMGATLPAMEQVLARLKRQGNDLAALYAGNTFGAVAGVLAAAFWLVPQYGLARTAVLCAALNAACALMVLRLAPATARQPAPAKAIQPVPARTRPMRLPWGAVRRRPLQSPLPRLAATGLLGIGYEVLVVRVLSQLTENTVYTFAMLLAVYLVGTALGAAACQRWPVGRRDAAGAGDRLVWSLAAACLVGTAALWQADVIKAVVQQALGAGMAAALAAEAALAAVVFLPPTVAMGALFSHLGVAARDRGTGFGRALGVNTLGAAAAPLLFGVVLMPAVGAKWALLAVVAGYLALLSRRAWRAGPPWLCATAALGLAAFAPPLRFVEVPEGGRIVSYQEGATATVSVVEDAGGVDRLRIDNRQQEGTSATLLADGRQALLPLLLHPAPRRALFLGLGTGVTAATAATEPDLQVDAVELLPEVIAVSAGFTRDFALGTPPRLHLIAADARRFVRSGGPAYDVIVADNFHPARSGSGALYTVEHFDAVRRRLSPDGIFCQWLPLHQLDLDTLRSIVRSFVAVYPDASALLATNSLQTPVFGLIGRRDAGRFEVTTLRQGLLERSRDTRLPRPLAEFGLTDDLSLLGSFVAGPRALSRFAGVAPLNTDDHPVVTYLAPRITYAPDSLPAERLVALLHEMTDGPEAIVTAQALVVPPPEADWSRRLVAYWRARDRFIEAGQGVRPAADVRQMLSQVREPLLAVLRISPDFRPAREPLLRMARALAATDPAAANALLAEMAALRAGPLPLSDEGRPGPPPHPSTPGP